MGNFLRDRAESQVAVDLILNYLIDKKGWTAHELEGRKEQEYGDIRCYPEGNMDKPLNIEVKFDKASERYGNICFEVANNKGMTGISKTKADWVVYVCPTGKEYTVFVFQTHRLKEFLFDPLNSPKITFKNGGDGKRFTLALVKKDTIVNSDVWSQMWKLP